MKKSILNLKGAQELSKKEQKEVKGGAPKKPVVYNCNTADDCPSKTNSDGSLMTPICQFQGYSNTSVCVYIPF